MIQLMPHHLVAMYDCLRALPPFEQWGLPESDEVEFHVTRNRRDRGDYTWKKTRRHPEETHVIYVSGALIATFGSLARVMAHEMIHLYQRHRKSETSNTVHNAEWHALAEEICDIHGWDYRLF
ncbi:conserved protein of unknown function [Georgfuchsia toluolica]|uniref:SprT-like domain-containing protein n=1 Tax=Georgfuchsia toluolica TaxID=424218 RepID=A0A916J0I7_9PROT|nr:SprT-like domain-containing protein [Georgfuchsia toluolica]CAG4882363.1 conserved protein of unknown function [Georgfuchsia toluolica]